MIFFQNYVLIEIVERVTPYRKQQPFVSQYSMISPTTYINEDEEEEMNTSPRVYTSDFLLMTASSTETSSHVSTSDFSNSLNLWDHPLEYGCRVWDPHKLTQIESLEKN